ncbi:hypothetical protein Hanom_Chr08g00703451 [Helianthus anomalus]
MLVRKSVRGHRPSGQLLFLKQSLWLQPVKPQQGDFSSLFDAPLSPSHNTAADAGVNKEFTCPFVKVVSEPSARVEDI